MTRGHLNKASLHFKGRVRVGMEGVKIFPPDGDGVKHFVPFTVHRSLFTVSNPFTVHCSLFTGFER
jgi:hypothetical protein